MAKLSGVIAAAATPLKADFSIDLERLVAHCRRLLEHGGCDGINLLGTTGEAVSFSVAQRMEAMAAIAKSGLPLDRFMVGTGATAFADTAALTNFALEAGFCGALVLPPFYYKEIDPKSLEDYFCALVDRLAAPRLYLYHIPQNTGVPFPIPVVERLADRLPDAILGLKDSSGDLAYSTELARRAPQIDVFPSSEGSIASAVENRFAGCISATVNVNGALAGQAWAARYSRPASPAVERAMRIRNSLAKFPLVAAVKWTLGRMYDDPVWRRTHPPLRPLTAEEGRALDSQFTLAELDHP